MSPLERVSLGFNDFLYVIIVLVCLVFGVQTSRNLRLVNRAFYVGGAIMFGICASLCGYIHRWPLAFVAFCGGLVAVLCMFVASKAKRNA